MDPEESTSIPLRLRDKRGIVFGNLPEIYKFHETLVTLLWYQCHTCATECLLNCSVFSKALEQYGDHPAKIGECFVQHVSQKTSSLLQILPFLFNVVPSL